jgi:hypothetical protein
MPVGRPKYAWQVVEAVCVIRERNTRELGAVLVGQLATLGVRNGSLSRLQLVLAEP